MAGTSRFTPRRLLGLIEWLPEDSAFVASQRGGPEHRAWPLSTVLAAGVFNTLQAANYQRGGGKSKRPKPITPPEPTRRGKRQSLRDWRRHNIAAARVAAQRPTDDRG